MKEKKYQEKIFEHIRMKSIEKDFISLHYVFKMNNKGILLF